MNITLIASDNGLGHIKRIIFLSNILVLKNNVILMAPKNKVKKFKLNKKIKVENYEMEIDIKKNSYNYNWIKNINDKILNKTDLFISDNLPEILSLEQNSFLYANFLWHKILNIKKKIKAEKDGLLKKNKFPILGCYLFMHPNIFNNFRTFRTGLFGKFEGKKKSDIKNILISLGTAKLNYQIIKQIKNEIKGMLQNFENKRINFYLDPVLGKIIKKDKNLKIAIADYSEEMFKKIDIAIIKPGLGTVNDCLKYSIPIISYTSDFNREFAYNTKIIKKNKLGFGVNNFAEVPKILKMIKKKKNFFNQHYLICKKLKWNGEKEMQKAININY